MVRVCQWVLLIGEKQCVELSRYMMIKGKENILYIANAPEYGKKTFKERLDKEILSIKKQFPEAKIIGVADGAKENWTFLEQYTVANTLDYYHATEYLSKASKGIHPRSKVQRETWYEKASDTLKNVQDGAKDLLQEIEGLKDKKLSLSIKNGVDATITYFNNMMWLH
ncbi:MAG: Unknown protein [uncultured Sulfurovum sp.]|uniref:Transposase n=1 Tax=uncultured Sulfurovum sp. TaxID=269237 RepID=A0A6S6TV46_9BACT|nr:MAG: Unknown protein [uncultured Sulfurovum sp.]